MNQIDPKSLVIHSGLPPVAKKGDRVSIDTEFFGMEKSKLHRPHGRFAGMGCSFDGVNVYIITDEEMVQDFMWQLDEAVHIYHNSLFDIRHIRRYCEYPDRTRIWDTMVLEQIKFAGWFSAGEFSLADLARRYLDIYMPKEVREEFAADDVMFMTQEQKEYLAMDVVATWRVYQEQKKIMDENDLNVWKNIDRPAIYSLLKTHGMKLDVEAWNELYKLNLSESERIQGKYGHTEVVEEVREAQLVYPDIHEGGDPESIGVLIPYKKSKKSKFVGINLGSWQQVLKRLKADGFDVESTDEKALTAILGDSEFANEVLEYRGRVKAAGTYGMKWVEEWLEADGRIYSNFYVNGTATGRFSSSNPNVENIPVRDGTHFRKCFVAAPGNILIDADFSAQEPRVWAYIAQDDDMIQLFKDKLDIYLYFALKGFGWDMPKSDPRRKERMKPTVLGAIFGLTKYGLLQKDQIPLEEGEDLLNTFWNVVFPQSKEYADEIRKTRDYVQTVYGRKYWINPYQNGHENNCLNSPVQGTAADIIKISGYCFQQEIEKAGYADRVWIINYIHDEILVECAEELKDWTMATLRSCMVGTAESTHEGVPADVEISFGMNWADAH
jgi:DNA polymerase I-like protein with 3'-5' exonuclease and polymerase domains